MSITSSAVFCPSCNAAIDRRVMELAIAPWDMKCPRCMRSPLAMFYTYGSQRHRLQCEEFWTYMRQPDSIPPLPFPEEVPA